MTQDKADKGASGSSKQRSFDAFISYASPDHEKARRICDSLESRDLKCWIAPRDVRPGAEYGEEIVAGIRESRCLVLVLSEAANASPMVRREVERAVSSNKPVFPIRIEDVLPSRSLEFFVSATHWIDAWQGALLDHAQRLADELSDERALQSAASEIVKGKRRRARRRQLSASSIAVLAIAVVAVILALRSGGGGGNAPRQADPARAVAETQGFDIDNVGAEDFDLSVSRDIGMSRLIIETTPKLQPLISRHLMEFRIAEGPWRRVTADSFTGSNYGILNEHDLDAGGPVDLQIGSSPMHAGSRTYGPFTYDIQVDEALLRWTKATIADGSAWMEWLPSLGWSLSHDALQTMAGAVRSISVGESRDELSTTIELPEITDDEDAIVSNLRLSGEISRKLQRELGPLRLSTRLYARLLFKDGTTSEVIELTAPKEATYADAYSADWPSHPAAPFDGGSDSAWSRMQRPGFQIGRLDIGRLSLSGLSEFHPAVKEVRVRRTKDEPARTIRIFTSDQAESQRPDPSFSLVFPGDGVRRTYRPSIDLPRSWDQAHVEVVLTDGRIYEQTLTASNGSGVGFTGEPIGANADQAPPLYVSYSGARFELFPWHDHPLVDPELSTEDLRHPDDTVEIAFRNESGSARQYFTYSMRNMVRIAEHLPFSVRTERVQATVVYAGGRPPTAIDMASDGSRLLVTTDGGGALVIDGPTREVIAEVSADGDYPARLSPDGLRVVAFYHKDTSRDVQRGGGAWGLFNASDGIHIADLTYDDGSQPHGGNVPTFTAGGTLVCFRVGQSAMNASHPHDSAAAMHRETGLWSLRDGRLVMSNDRYFLGAFDDDTRAVTLSTDRRTIRVHDLSTDPPALIGSLPLSSSVNASDLSTQGSLLALHMHDSKTVSVYSLPDLEEQQRVFSARDFQNLTPQFDAQGRSLLVHPALSDRRYELIEARSGESLFKFTLDEMAYVSMSVAMGVRDHRAGRSLHHVPSGEPIDHLPFAAHDNYWRRHAISRSREDFLLWIKQKTTVGDTQELYFIDLEQPVSKQLMVDEGASCEGFVVSRDGDRIAAIQSTGSAIVWRTR